MSGSNGWSPERRQRQREAIQRWKPWEQSTGPRSEAGKARAAQNGRTHGLFDARSRELLRWATAMLREQRRGLKELRG